MKPVASIDRIQSAFFVTCLLLSIVAGTWHTHGFAAPDVGDQTIASNPSDSSSCPACSLRHPPSTEARTVTVAVADAGVDPIAVYAHSFEGKPRPRPHPSRAPPAVL
jgi:hypothetical protein